MQNKAFFDRMCLIASVCIFGSIGLFRRYIDLPSSLIALVRAVIGTVALLIPMLATCKKQAFSQVKSNLPFLLLSGTALGFNWIFLFEAYCYTTVATATLCYYMAPVIVILASPLLFKEKLTVKKLISVSASVAGILLISGILTTGSIAPTELRGIAFGLAAACLYATVIILNKKISGISDLLRTVIQLGIAAVVLLPYTLLTEDLSGLTVDFPVVILLTVLGIVHTAVAYALYFGSVKKLPTQTVAIFSYIDPVLAIILSAVILSEPLTLPGIIGSALILGAAIFSEIRK